MRYNLIFRHTCIGASSKSLHYEFECLVNCKDRCTTCSLVLDLVLIPVRKLLSPSLKVGSCPNNDKSVHFFLSFSV